MLSVCEQLADAFHSVGDAWECSDISVYREHVASQIGYRVLLDLKSTLNEPPRNASAAIGCTPEGDPYALPTMMVELVLREFGWQAQSLGSDLPLEMLEPAVEEMKPEICWVSVSYIDSTSRLQEQLEFLADLGVKHRMTVLCGGQALQDQIRSNVSGIKFVDHLRALEQFAG